MRKTLYLIIIGMGILQYAPSLPAAMFTYPLNFEYSGTAPTGTPPWLIAEIKDVIGDEDRVEITMSTPGLVNNEFVGGWYFNLDFDFADLYYGEDTDPGPDIFISSSDGTKAESVSYNPNGINAGGSMGHGFDIFFDFPESDSGDNSRFGSEETVIYQIRAKPGTGLDAEDFNVFNVLDNGEAGTFYTAAHVQVINVDDSGWIAATESISPIPEPATILLLGIGLAGLLGIRRFRYKNN